MLVYFMVIGSIFLPFGTFCGHFPPFWYVYQEKSGNPVFNFRWQTRLLKNPASRYFSLTPSVPIFIYVRASKHSAIVSDGSEKKFQLFLAMDRCLRDY
jgi:hypothetical protein